MDLVVNCYELCKYFPKSELYGLASQLQRAAVSVPANIAEGHQRQHSKEYIQHLSIAYASLAELETHVLIANRLAYIEKEKTSLVLNQTSEVGKMLNGLKHSIKKKL